ncbi:MAG: hypothetical protein AB7I38_00105 [Dehalococcoidia bacterium]
MSAPAIEGAPKRAATLHSRGPLSRGSRFFRTPKGLMLIILAGLLGVATTQTDAEWPRLLLAGAGTAAFLDMAIVFGVRGEWRFPSGALLTGLFIAGLIDPYERVEVVVVASTVAILAKHIVRIGGGHVFNPAALALVVTSLAFESGQSWWGALPDMGVVGVVAVGVSGWYMASRINKLPMVAAFLGAYFTAFTAAASFGQADGVAEVFRAPDLHAALFFAFFMLDDPPTSPVRYRDQAAFGAMVALTSFFVYMRFGVVYFLLAGLLAGNAIEAVRRATVRRRRRARSSKARADAAGSDHTARAAA